MNKVISIIKKEWSEVFKNRLVLFSTIFLPLLLTAIPLVILYSLVGSGSADSFSLGELSPQFQSVCGDLKVGECNQFVIITQFMPMFLMMPGIIPVTIAAYSIVGEKTSRTLEPLLATPISTIELLLGKGLAAALPAIIATWLAFGVFVLGAIVMRLAPSIIEKFFEALWLIAIFIVGPLLAMASVSFAVMISSRTSDARVAEQISGLFVLPVVALIIAQVSGAIFLNETLILWIALVLVLVDVVLIYIAVKLFQRETILTRWR